MMGLIGELWMKNRTLVSSDLDASLCRIQNEIDLKIHTFPSGKECWTWIIPEQWEINEAYISDTHQRIIDFKNHPLHVVSYSLPVNKEVSKEELFQHLHWRKDRPNAIPYEYKYYERDWGFCIPYERVKSLTADCYKVYIDSHFESGELKVGDFTIPGKVDDTIVLVAHLCHPAQVNDGLTGVAVAVDLAKRLKDRKNLYTYKFLFTPETIGSVAYLSQNEDIIPKIRCGIFLEMLGNNNTFALQHSYPGTSRIDRVARYVISRRHETFREGQFRRIIGNDEMVFNGPGVGIPMISISRWPYPEYHTSDDNPSIINEERLEEARDLILEILEIFDKDYIPQRTFKGPVFLSRYGLWVDWRVHPELKNSLESIMLNLEGDKSVFDIAFDLDIDYETAYDQINKFAEKGLITKIDSLTSYWKSDGRETT